MRRFGPTLLLAATLVFFLPSLWGDFVYDDWRFIVDNPFVKSSFNPTEAFTNPHTIDTFPTHDIYRPLRTLLFQIGSACGGGKPFAHHLISLLIHLTNVYLAFLWIRRLLDPESRGDKG
ncbi:MAG: hypothetical protein KJ645_04005, partial [Planctomycetes bacterium]|nr:hypothetical protein [Planctomycetota bacterium]